MTIVRWIFALLLTALIGVLAMGAMKPRHKPPTTVTTTRAERTTITRTVSGAGKLEPARKVNVSANITGTLLDLRVDIGSVVKKGDYLGQIDTSRYVSIVSRERGSVASARADVNRVKARITSLRRDLQRIEALVAKNALGTQDLEIAEASLRQAEAELAAAESRVQSASAGLSEANQSLEWATLRAPVDGTVLSLNHRVGERLRGSDMSEDVILVIGAVTEMEVKIEVGEHDVVFIKPGQRTTIEIDALPDQPLGGRVIESGRDAKVKNAGTDNEVTTFEVWIALDAPPPSALSGMSARVDIYTETRENVLAVPIQAVTVRPPERGGAGDKTAQAGAPSETAKDPRPPAVGAGGGSASPAPAGPTGRNGSGGAAAPPGAPGAPGAPPGGGGGNGSRLEKVVFVHKDGKVERRKVTTGLSSEQHVEILDGLAEGEEVIEGPYRVLARQLQGGDEVQVEGGGQGGGGRGGQAKPGGARGGPQGGGGGSR